MKNSSLLIALFAAVTAAAIALVGCVDEKASVGMKDEQAQARPNPAPKPEPLPSPEPRPVVPRPGPTNTGDPGPPSAPKPG